MSILTLIAPSTPAVTFTLTGNLVMPKPTAAGTLSVGGVTGPYPAALDNLPTTHQPGHVEQILATTINDLARGVNALENKVGIIPSTPTNGQVFTSNANGAGVWQTSLGPLNNITLIPDGGVQLDGASSHFSGVGPPSPSLGQDGDYYWRKDTPAVSTQLLYVKSGGVWTSAEGPTALSGYIANAVASGMSTTVAALDPRVVPPVSLATLIASAGAGTTVVIPDGVYREQVTIAKSLTLVPLNPGKVSIKGSDVWGDTSWVRPSNFGTQRTWMSNISVPTLATDPNGTSFSTTNPEQVFYDGIPLNRVKDGMLPRSGEFALDLYRRVIIQDRPLGHIVEVTTRPACIIASGATRGLNTITLNGLDVRHAASWVLGPSAAIRGNSDVGVGTGQVLIMTNCTVMHNHGCGIGGAWAPGSSITGCTVAENGGFGANFNQDLWDSVVPNSTAVTFSNNVLRHNNTLGYSVVFGAGGIKVTRSDNVTMNSNTVYSNNGEGLWFDISNTRVTCQNNVCSYNQGHGVMFEISGARNNGSGTILYTGTPSDISGNVCYENLWSQFDVFSGGGGIFCSSSTNVNIHNNTVAWSWSPIYVWWDFGRGSGILPTGSGTNTPTGIKVYSNTLITEGALPNTFNPDNQLIKFNDQQGLHIGGALGLYWNGGHNGAYLNKVWNAGGDGTYFDEYQYDGNISTLATLNTVGTGGNSGGNLDSLGASTLISATTGYPVPVAVATILNAAGIPLLPAAGHGNAWNNGPINADGPRYVALTANTTLTDADLFAIGDATAGNITITLPDGRYSWQSGRDNPLTIKRKDSSANTFTIATTASQTIDGLSTRTLSALGTICLIFDGANWWITSASSSGSGGSGSATFA